MGCNTSKIVSHLMEELSTDIQKELNPAEMEQISGGHSTEHYTKKIYRKKLK